MLKNKKLMAVATFMLAIGMVISVSTKAEVEAAEAGKLQIVRTVCIHKVTGEIVAYSNDCWTGTSNCIDNTCP